MNLAELYQQTPVERHQAIKTKLGIGEIAK